MNGTIVNRVLAVLLLTFLSPLCLAGEGDPPGEIGDIVYEDAYYLLVWHRPGHTGLYVGLVFDGSNDAVIHCDKQAYAPEHPQGGLGDYDYSTRAIYCETLEAFSDYVGFGSKTQNPFPSPSQRMEICSYAMAKLDLPISYFDDNVLNPKGQYTHPSTSDLTAAGYANEQEYQNDDIWLYDSYNEFDCVGFAERAYEVAGLDPTSSADEGWPFFVEHQWNSSHVQWAQAFPPKVLSRSHTTARNTNIDIIFAPDNLDTSSFSGHITVVGSSTGSHVPVTSWTPSEYKLTIDPQNDFAYGETVTVTLTTGIRDLAGNGLDGDGDGDEGPNYSFSFTVQSQPGGPRTSINITSLTLDPPSVEPYGSFQVRGTTSYNNGEAVNGGTAQIVVQDGSTYTTPVTNGFFSRSCQAPGNNGTSQISKNVAVTVSDGVVTAGTASQTLTVLGQGGTSYDLSVYTVYDAEYQDGEISQWWYKDAFRTTDDYVGILPYFQNVSGSRDLPLESRIYKPDGTQYGSSGYNTLESGNWEWYVPDWTYWYISSHSMAYNPGQYTAKFYVDGSRKWSKKFVVGWNFTQHFMCKDHDADWNPIGETSVFAPTDAKAMALHHFEFQAQEIPVRTEFYAPDGICRQTSDWTIDADGLGENEWYPTRRHQASLNIAGTDRAYMCGDWIVKFYIKNPGSGAWEQKYTDYFRIEEKTPPAGSVSASPAVPIETQTITLNVSATDDNNLQKVVLYWNDGSAHNQTWDNINSSSFSTTKDIGSGAAGQQIEYWCEVWDESGNRAESTHQTLTVQSEVVSVPTIPSGPAEAEPNVVVQFVTGGSTTTLGAIVEYQFDWGDGPFSSWGSATQSHSWTNENTFQVAARARSQARPARVSGWSSSSAINIRRHYSLMVTPNPANGGTVTASPLPEGDGKYLSGTVVQLTANPASDYNFSLWGGDASGNANPLQITMTSDKSITANFSSLPTNGWASTGSMTTARAYHTATLLPNGKVLVAGGLHGGALASVELYDPAGGTWTATGALTAARFLHTATLLPNGKVLVAGGEVGLYNYLSSAELYDPATGAWTATGSMAIEHHGHTATLLPSGKVLVVGGWWNSGNSAELYDPATGIWTPTGSLTTARYGHTATLLPNGKVLVAGGYEGGNSTELYDPATGMWTASGVMTTPREDHRATLLPNGKVLVTGGYNGGPLSSAELYDPASGTWTTTAALPTATRDHTATLLPNGKVLVAGGYEGGNNAELYDPATGTWTPTSGLSTARYWQTATLLPNGSVLVAGGFLSAVVLSSAELYDPAAGAWTVTGSLTTVRALHTATLLPNGKVLVAGGWGAPANAGLASAELYDPANGLWTNTGAMTTERWYDTATLLPNGKVLVAGGWNGSYLSSAEAYDPASGTWTSASSMTTARAGHTATLLPNGKVLVAGGYSNNGGWLSSVELYDLTSGTWTETGALTTARQYHTATLLPNGKVLVAGGWGAGDSAEVYDPATGTWTTTGSLTTARYQHTATLLPNGKVLVTGGWNGTYGSYLSNAELYDPDSGTWTATGSLTTARVGHTATLLLNGKVLAAGGWNGSPIVGEELYDPAKGLWTIAGSMTTEPAWHTGTLLPNGNVLVAGGSGSSSVELYDVGLEFSVSWQPQIATFTSPLNSGGSLVLTGSQFRGISEGSGGNTQDSPADYPVVQLRNVESGQTLFLLPTSWSTNSFTSAPVSGFPGGYSLVTVFVNGIPSTSSILSVINSLPVASFSATPTSGVAPLTVTFTDTSTGSSITNRLWNFGDGGSGSGTNPSHTYTNAGTFSVGLTIFSLYGTTTLVTSNLITVSAPPPLSGGYVQAVTNASPVAYWRLNETNGATVASDFLGFHNGTISANVTPGVSGPRNPPFPGFETNNTAMQFNYTSGSYLTMPALNLNTNTVTITGWINPTGSQAGWAGIAFCRGGSTCAGLHFGPGSIQNELRYSWNNSRWDKSTGLAVPTGQWSFVALVVTPTNGTIYMGTNGILNSFADAVSEPSQAFDASLLIGYDPSEGSRLFRGVIDEVAIYNRSLTPTQIQELYNSAFSTPPPPTPFQTWQFRYFGCTNCPQAEPTTDPDGDGQNNLAEYLAGTDPTNNASAFRIISIAREGNNIRVTWNTGGGTTNVLQTTAGYANGSYTTNFVNLSGLIIIPGSGDTTTNSVDIGGATNFPARYYRVRLVP